MRRCGLHTVHKMASSGSRARPAGINSMAIVRLFRCITGPKLRRLYYQGYRDQGVAYEPNKAERYADNVILAAYLLCSFAYHISPFYFAYQLIRHGIPSLSGILGTFKIFAFVPISVSLAYIVRGFGRFKNETYNNFLISLTSVRQFRGTVGPAEASSTGIDGYDFQFSSYPITFRHSESSVRPRRLSSLRRKGIIEKLTHLPISTLRYIAAHFVGRRAIYPGSNAIFHILLETPLSEGRAKLRKKYNANRAKLLSVDGNCIDSVFIDRRGSPDANAKGNKLVICCEGNAAYYEVGLPEIPLMAGFSVLGWNHPGFAESTGLPFPDQEFHAIDVVIRYAVTRLGFEFSNIIILAWSIGGYTASCAAMSYPDIGGMILDATFDELFPLAKQRISPFLESFTRGMVDEYYNLNIAQQIKHYSGPLLVIRRELDEMMSINSDVATNRANYLLVQILQSRYPNLVSAEALRELWNWLKCVSESYRNQLVADAGVNPSQCKAKIINYMSFHGSDYPWLIGDGMTEREKIQLILFLATQYMLNHRSTHCQPLPVDYLFCIPDKKGNLRE